MTVLFAAAQLGREDWARLPFQNRVEMIKSHYELAKWPHITTHEWFFPETGVGIFVACQQPDLKNFRHFSPGRTPVFVTHFPFGYKAVVPGTPLESIGQALCFALSKDGSLVTKLAPPLAVLRVDEERGSFDFWNDVLGLGKTFLHETSGGKAKNALEKNGTDYNHFSRPAIERLAKRYWQIATDLKGTAPASETV